MGDGADETPQPTKFSLKILDCIDEVQGLHGVPIGDYSSYRSYCTRRLRRLRSAVPQLLSHASKYAEVKSNRRHGFCPRKDPEDITHENIVWNYLFLAERAWAHAMISNESRRFNKAAKWAVLLQDAADRSADESTQLQARGYAAWMQGNAALAHKDFGTAHGYYSTCSKCWEHHTERMSALQPLIRYCQYEANLDDDNNEAAPSETKENKIVLEFRGETVGLDSYQALALAYLKIQSTDETNIDQLLVDIQDALLLVPPELPLVRDYLEFKRRAYWQTLQESRDPSTDLYEALQENAKIMADSCPDEDDPDRLLAAAHTIRFRAFKCFYLAKSQYEEGSQEQLTLLRHAKKIGKDATEEMVACADDENDLDAVLDALEKLDREIDVQLLRCETTRIIDGGARNRPLWMRLDEPDGSGPLVDDPPKPLPLAAKGIFFDLAWPYVAASTDDLRPDEPKQTSFLGRWFSSSKP